MLMFKMKYKRKLLTIIKKVNMQKDTRGLNERQSQPK